MPEKVFNKGKRFNVNGDAEVYVDNEKVVITAGKDVGVVTHKDFGVAIQGDIALKAKPQDITVNMLYTFNDMLMTTLPSTIYTPIPTLRQGMASRVAHVGKLAAVVSELMGALEALV